MRTLILYHPACIDHRPGAHHPDCPERQTTVLNALQKKEFEDLIWREAPLGKREQLLLVHKLSYVERIERVAPSKGYHPLDAGDTVMSPGSLEAVLRCVGAACAGVDAVIDQENIKNVFCATRPCGHHAESDRAMGFSIFNHAAIAAFYANRVRKMQKVAVIDFDVHHGNGTQNSFYDEPNLFYGSTHQSPFYPGTGAKHETGSYNNIVNIPLARGCDSATFRARVSSIMLPALRRFAPNLLIISAGFDSHYKDLLGGMSLTDGDFYWITRELLQIAEETAENRVVSILEGGYSMEGLASGTTFHVRALMGK